MDTEVPHLDTVTSYNLEKTLKNIRLDKGINLRQSEAKSGMPWKSSIDPKVKDEQLLYMPFWEWQMQFMEENLTNLRVEPCHNGETDFTYNENQKKNRFNTGLLGDSADRLPSFSDSVLDPISEKSFSFAGIFSVLFIIFEGSISFSLWLQKRGQLMKVRSYGIFCQRNRLYYRS
jgi:hypothetical protein